MAADRQKETQLWAWLRTAARAMRGRADVQRIENAVASGTPDVEGCIDGGTFWCELKVAHEVRGGYRVLLTPIQAYRAGRRVRAGGRSWVLVRTCGAKAHLNRHYLVDGADAERLLDPVTEAELTALSRAHSDATATYLLETMAGK